MLTRLLTLLIVIALCTSLVLAQMGPNGKGARNYNVANEITVKGTVEDVQTLTSQKGSAGLHLTFKSDQGTFEVHVGPSAYVSSKQFSFAKDDNIEVIGSKMKLNGQDTLIARQITKNGKTLALRNEQGFPLWSRGGAAVK